jgi:hypothetical protein
MKIELKEITIKELSTNFVDNAEDGVKGYGGLLDIRPPYQREFIYKDRQRDAVIDTVTKNYPLNVMYWATRDDGTYEIIDGQQRTISICQYINGDFAHVFRYFHNLTKEEQAQILNYKLMVYICTGGEKEKLEWFRTINIAGEKLTEQELRNAVYSGSWVTDAKRHFSKTGCPAYNLASDYMTGSTIRQEYLEAAIDWLSKGNIEQYMAVQQHSPNANALWLYFQKVINWAKTTFPQYRTEMKGLNWGELYNEYSSKEHDSAKLEEEISRLMQDDEVGNRRGIYYYVLNRKEKHLNLRAFTPTQKREVYEKQKGICKECKEHFTIEQMEADHIIPWHKGGKTDINNCQLLCMEDNRKKSGK